MIWNFWRVQIFFSRDGTWFPYWGKYCPQAMPKWVIFRYFVWGPFNIRYFPKR